MAFFGRNSATKNPLSRRLFFWTLACTFFMTTSTVIFFSLGYRYTFIEDIFLHTGSVNFKSQPRSVDITVDDKKPPARHLNIINSSRHVTGLRHGFYTLGASAEGYKPWSKDIRIRSGLATEFWNVILLQENYERTDFSVLSPSRLFFTPNNQFLAYPQIDTEDSSLYVPILDVENNQVTETYTIPYAAFTSNTRENIEWSPNTRFLTVPIQRSAEIILDDAPEEALTTSDPLLKNQLLSDDQQSLLDDVPTLLNGTVKDYVIIDRQTDDDLPASSLEYLSQKISDLATTLRANQIVAQSELPSVVPTLADADELIDPSLPPRMLRWHPDQENTLLALLGTDLLLFAVDSDDVFSAQVFARNVLAYDFADDGIYILRDTGELEWGQEFLVETPELLTRISPQGELLDAYRLIAYDNSRILIIDDAVGSLTIYNAFEEVTLTRKAVESGISGAQFSDDGKKIMYHTDKEVFIYFAREWVAQPYRPSNTEQRILEADATIQAIEWTSDYEHLVVAIEDKLYLAELDDRGEYRVEEFLKRSVTDSNVTADQEENQLYFTEIGQDGLVIMQSITFPYEKQGLF